MKKMLLALFLSILAILFTATSPPVYEAVDGPYNVNLYARSVQSTNFSIGTAQFVDLSYSGSVGSNWYVHIKQGSTIIDSPHSYSTVSSNGYLTSINGYDKVYLNPGQYTLEAYGGTAINGSGYINVTLKYMNRGTFLRISSTYQLPIRINTPVYYIWSGRTGGSYTKGASLTINGGNTSISLGNGSYSGYFVATGGTTYNIVCDGGYLKDQYGKITNHYYADVQLYFDDPPLQDQISVSIPGANTNPHDNKIYTHNPVTLNWTNRISGGYSNNRTYRIYDRSVYPVADITPNVNTLNIGSVQLNLLSEGEHDIYIVGYDDYGNASPSSDTYKLFVYNTPPSGKITLNNQFQTQPYTNKLQLPVFLNQVLVNNVSGLFQVRFSEDGKTYQSWQPIPYVTNLQDPITVIYTLSSAVNGNRTIYSQVMDYAGNTTIFTNNIIFDNQPPTNCNTNVSHTSPGLNVVSKNGVTYVSYTNPNDRKPVMLDFSGMDNLTGVVIHGLDADPHSLSWNPALNRYTGSFPWSLSQGDGPKTVAITFKDGAENEYASVPPVAVTLDTTAPAGQINSISNSSIYSSNGLLYTKDSVVTLALQGGDGNGIGLGQKCLNLYNLYEGMSDGEINDNNWLDYNSSVIWNLLDGQPRNDGPITVCAVFRDLLGNIQSQRSIATIILDRTSPGGACQVQAADGRNLDTGEHSTGSRNVKIIFSNVDDANGYFGYNSGLKGVYVWDDVNTTPMFIPASSFADGGYTADWIFGSNSNQIPEGNHVINIQVVDNVGNSLYISKYFTYDTTPPAPAPLSSFGREQLDPSQDPVSEKQLKFTWDAGSPFDDTNLFKIKYTLPDGYQSNSLDVTPTLKMDNTQTVTGKQGSYSVPVLSPGYNQKITIEVTAFDKALNSSTPTTYSGYTDAALGDLHFVGADYNPVTKHHQLKWHVEFNPGESKSQVVRLGQMVGNDFKVLGSATADVQGNAIIENLNDGQTIDAHSTGYSYQLVAYNGSDNVTAGEVIKLNEIPNLPPTKPIPQTPVGFAGPDAEFIFTPSVEPDGDPRMTQTICIAKGTNPAADSFKELSQWTEGFIYGQTYTWKVVADDQQGGITESDLVSFTVDNVNPTISAQRPDRIYTNQTGLVFTAGDDLGGVQTVTYEMIDSKTDQPIKTGVINFTGNNRTVTGTIPLVEGSYHLSIQANDAAGNPSEECHINNLKVDRTGPVLLPGLTIDLPQSGGKYVSGTLQIPLKGINAGDKLSGIGGIVYWLVKDKTVALDINQATSIAMTRNELANYQYNFTVTGESGQEYYLAIAVTDQAGNRSGIIYAGPILLDLNPPTVSIDAQGMVQYGASNYVTDLKALYVTVSVTGRGTQAANFDTQLAIVDAAGKTVSAWIETWEDLNGTALTPGGKYRITARVRNQLTGLTTVKSTPEFTYDNTPPQILSIAGPIGTVSSGEQVIFKITAEDQETAIKEYRLAIRLNAPEIFDLSSEIPGNQDGWIIVHPGQNPTEIRLEIPSGVGGVYYPVVQAVNTAGLNETINGQTFTIETNQEKLSVQDQGPYSMFDDHLTGTWKYLGSRQVADYRYRIISLDNQPVTDWKTTVDTMVTVTGLALESGKQYRFEVQVRYDDGYGESNYSSGVTIDNTKPNITKLITPEYTTSDKLGFFWEGSDPESAVTLVQAALGSDFYNTDISGGWVTINANSSTLAVDAQGNPLQLETGRRYYLTLRLVNGAGLATEIVGNGIMIDDTPPPVPVVMDQGACINTKQFLQANWLWSPEDPESGPDTYQWALIENIKDLDTTVWHNADANKRIKLTELLQQHGHTYYFAVRAINQTGLASIGISDGIIADETAPFISEVKLLDAVNLSGSNLNDSPELNYITKITGLDLWINSVDIETPVTRYLYTWGTRENVAGQELRASDKALIPLDGLNNPKFQPAEGVVTFFIGESENEVQLVSAPGYSSGVILDTSSPKMGAVHGGACGTSLLFDWQVKDSHLPIAFYEIKLVAPEEVNSVPTNMENAGLTQNYVFDHIPDGKYRLLVRATNQAGTTSRRNTDIDEWGISPIVMIDTTPPEIRQIYCDKYVSDRLKFQVTAVDNLSGVRSYQYALGSITNPYQYSGGWVDVEQPVENLAQIIDTTHIPHNSVVYLMVRVKDNAGLWSKPQISGKIIVDRTKPELPVVASNKYTTSKTMITGIAISAGDPESGITQYRIGTVTQPGLEWLTSQVISVGEFDGSIIGLNMVEAGVYYLAVQTQNGADEWSDTGYSGPVTVDTIAPEFKFPEGEHTIVINHPPLKVQYTLSEDSRVNFSLVDGDSNAKPYVMEGKAGTNEFDFEEDIPVTYKLYALVTDPAGNTGNEELQKIRVNAPPQITLPVEINTTPGQPIALTATVFDPDGEAGDVFCYEWNPGDGGSLLIDSTPEHKYIQLGDYTLSVTVIDKDGGKTTATTTVKVRNTTRGQLYIDEVWSGVHTIYGDVTIPAGIKLTIQSGTQIIVNGIVGDTGFFNGLIVKGNLEAQPGVVFDAVNRDTGEGLITGFGDGSGNDGWKGIIIEGNAGLNGVTFRHAFRALTVYASGKAKVDNCIFEDNYVAIHVYESQPLINNCQFINNQWYGIKEDRGCRPVVTNCGFSGNEMDYYQDGAAEISMDELNQIPGNRGNHN